MRQYTAREIKQRNSRIENEQYRNKSGHYVAQGRNLDPHKDEKNQNNTLLNAHYAKLRREQ